MMTSGDTIILLSFTLGMTLSFSLMACVYLLLSKKAILSENPAPYQAVRRDAGWLIAVFAGSHVLALISFFFGGFGSTAMILASMYDMLFSLPFALKFLIRLLQNRTFCWQWILIAEIPLVVTAIGYIATLDVSWYVACKAVTALILLTFSIWYFFSVRRYSDWLRDNFADLKYKETWWSFIVIGIVMLLYLSYFLSINSTGIFILRLVFILMVTFITWRADSVQNLSSLTQSSPLVATHEETDGSDGAAIHHTPQTDKQSTTIPDFTEQLEQMAQETQFYLQYDFTKQQLALMLGTNRTYLSRYFMEQGTTFNSYVNRLRINHFICLYQAEVEGGNMLPVIKPLSEKSGFRSYFTFYDVFKRTMGMNVTQWAEGNNGKTE